MIREKNNPRKQIPNIEGLWWEGIESQAKKKEGLMMAFWESKRGKNQKGSHEDI